MKRKKNSIIALVIISLCAVSWGTEGHRTVALIAQNHLTDKTQQAVKALLGHSTLVDVSNDADDIRSRPGYRYTASWHFVNLPSGYDFARFADAIKNDKADNAYKMILRCERYLESPQPSKREKADALTLLVHFVGDVHQPMHVSHAEDRGGNNTSVKFFGVNYSLHGLWDSGIIDHEGLNYQKLAGVCDTATPEQIKKWQTDSVMVWLWESYQISTILYQEAAANEEIGEANYKEHADVLNDRLEKGGIRLAGVLNRIFDK